MHIQKDGSNIQVESGTGIEAVDKILFVKAVLKDGRWIIMHEDRSEFCEKQEVAVLNCLTLFKLKARSLDKQIKNEITEAALGIREINNKISKRSSRVSKAWQKQIAEYEKAVFEQKEIALDSELYEWLRKQKRAIVKGTMSDEKIQKLVDINKNFITDIIADNWDKNFTELRLYIEKNNSFPSYGSRLYTWAHAQKRSIVDVDVKEYRTRMLLSLPCDFFKEPASVSWKKKLDEYAYTLNSMPGEPCIDKWSELGKWVARQKNAFNANKLSHYKEKQLLTVDDKFFTREFECNGRDIRLRKKIQEYQDYQTKPSIKSENPKEKSIAMWFQTQKTKYNKKLLSDAEIKKLSILDPRFFKPYE